MSIDAIVQFALTVINVLLVPLALKASAILWDHERRLISVEMRHGGIENAKHRNDR